MGAGVRAETERNRFRRHGQGIHGWEMEMEHDG